VSYVRRVAVGALAALLATAVLAACGSTASDDDAGSSRPWSFTSGNGKTVKLDSTPRRIIASGAEAAALISFGIKPVGIYATGPVKDDANLKNLDLSGITILSETWENLSWENADKYQPDLLLIDDRTYESTVKQGEKQPTWSNIKAGKAKAYVRWPAYWMHTYGEYAGQLTQLTAAIQQADADLA
jgi:ABC-type Fe3+-hydroxamate transport system substrate-binding protein